MRPNIDVTNQTDGAVQDYGEENDLTKQDAYSELVNHALTYQPLNDEAKNALIDHLTEVRFGGHDRNEAEHLVETGHTTLIKDYVSGSPGYRGDLILGIFGFPGTYTLYKYENGEITGEIDREGQK